MAKDLKPYVLLKTQDQVSGNGDQAHLFDFDGYDANGKTAQGVSKNSICNMVTKEKSGWTLSGETDSEELRVKIAKAQTRQDICGQCVGRLYKWD
ncbi:MULTISPECIES: hypothetical protein [unclassified Desulfovibrio]|uniref:hypothetical protein n=1 Tax=unclassified Desulfovibrio TaxID=2593640 RepID=UPI002FDA7072